MFFSLFAALLESGVRAFAAWVAEERKKALGALPEVWVNIEMLWFLLPTSCFDQGFTIVFIRYFQINQVLQLLQKRNEEMMDFCRELQHHPWQPSIRATSWLHKPSSPMYHLFASAFCTEEWHMGPCFN